MSNPAPKQLRLFCIAPDLIFRTTRIVGYARRATRGNPIEAYEIGAADEPLRQTFQSTEFDFGWSVLILVSGKKPRPSGDSGGRSFFAMIRAAKKISASWHSPRVLSARRMMHNR
jgi:hypothetical protein